MKLQVASDLHLDLCNNKFEDVIVPSAPYLALVGDIAEERHQIFYDFLKWTSKRFVRVFIVLGNHEFYNCDDMDNVIKRIKEFCGNISNVHLLEKNHLAIKEANGTINHILGTTMWSSIPSNKIDACHKYMNDYALIKQKTDSTSLITPKHTNEMHNKAAIWLLNEIKKIKKGDKIIVLTHHAPLLENVSNPKYETDSNNYRNAFCTDMTYMFENPISVWVYGHTHWVTEFAYGKHNTRIVSNCHGYGGTESINYEENKVLTI